jgi:hypothetical protein
MIMEVWIYRGIICWTDVEFFVLMDYMYNQYLKNSSDRTNIVYNDTVTNNEIGCEHPGCYWMVLK